MTRRKNRLAFRPSVDDSSLEERVALSGVSTAAALVARERQIIALERRQTFAEQSMIQRTNREVTQAFATFERAFRRDQGAFMRAQRNGSTTAAANFQANIANRLNVLAGRLNTIFAGLPAGSAARPTVDAITGTGPNSLLSTLNGLDFNTLGLNGFMSAAQNAIATARAGTLTSLTNFTASLPSSLAGIGVSTVGNTGLTGSSLSSLLGSNNSLSLTGTISTGTTSTGTTLTGTTGTTGLFGNGTGTANGSTSFGGNLAGFRLATGTNVFQISSGFQAGNLSLIQTITQNGTAFQNGTFFQTGTGTIDSTGSLTGTGTGTGTGSGSGTGTL